MLIHSNLKDVVNFSEVASAVILKRLDLRV